MTQTTDIYFDFEFMEDGQVIIPISLGMCTVAPLGQMGLPTADAEEFYLEYEFDPARANDWVRANVFPQLRANQMEIGQGCLRRSAAPLIKNWVKDVCGDSKPKFLGYYPSYDWVCLCQHFGAMVQMPKGWPFRPYCLMQMADHQGVPKAKFPKQTGEHHALEDAKWNRELHQYLNKMNR